MPFVYSETQQRKVLWRGFEVIFVKQVRDPVSFDDFHRLSSYSGPLVYLYRTSHSNSSHYYLPSHISNYHQQHGFIQKRTRTSDLLQNSIPVDASSSYIQRNRVKPLPSLRKSQLSRRQDIPVPKGWTRRHNQAGQNRRPNGSLPLSLQCHIFLWSCGTRRCDRQPLRTRSDKVCQRTAKTYPSTVEEDAKHWYQCRPPKNLPIAVRTNPVKAALDVKRYFNN